jgi:transcription antitermination factor NusG
MQLSLANGVAGEPGVQAAVAAQISSARWFAAYTNSQHERSVARQLENRSIEFFLPLYSITRRWKNRCRVNIQRALFPNYVFVHIDPRERVRVLEVPGVLSLVGFGRRLAPLSDLEIEALRSAVAERRIEPHPYLVVGERVRVKAGPLAGIEGVLVRKKSNFRVVLTLEVIMLSVAVEVDAADLDSIPQSAP